jgi:hypothetical protein
MNKIVILALFVVLAGAANPASAQNKYFRDFQDNMLGYHDIHEQRLQYFNTYMENRAELDARRRAFEAQRQEAVKAYNEHQATEERRINYEAGISDFMSN